jgi:hypothetical protein
LLLCVDRRCVVLKSIHVNLHGTISIVTAVALNNLGRMHVT